LGPSRGVGHHYQPYRVHTHRATNCASAWRIVERTIDELNIRRTLATAAYVVLNLEFHLLTFLDRIKHATGKGGMMKENLSAILTADESESAISDHPHYCALHEPVPPKQSAILAYSAKGARSVPDLGSRHPRMRDAYLVYVNRGWR
jgi:hypothetical protein